MAKSTRSIHVTTDVRRDLLQSAALFKNEAAVVWEYVVNSLQYVDRGTSPRVQVFVHQRRKAIEVSDNGRGMSAEELGHFFRMHGENTDRLRGHPGRGKFGTGKSAAFGIANVLTVDTRQQGLRNVVELTRAAIDASTGDTIPLDWRVRNEVSDQVDGTTISIEDIFLPKINIALVREYIERQLQAFRATSPRVAVNDHVCEYRQPSVAEEFTFRPSPQQVAALGDVRLLIRVAQSPLVEQDQGVFVTAGSGNLVACEKAGVDRKEMGNYLFGEIDVPALETSDSPIEAWDQSRSLSSLNTNHPTALVLIGFIGAKLEEVRTKLVAKQRDARRTEQARRLALEADRIAEILNKDFDEYRRKLLDIRAASSTRGPVTAAFGNSAEGDTDPDEWIKGFERPGDTAAAPPKDDGHGPRGRQAPDIAHSGAPNDEGRSSVDPAGGAGGARRKPRGGFKVDYRNLGADEARSIYDKQAFAILINLDHPVVVAALAGGSVDDPAFKRLSYEIAFSEYAMALGYEQTNQDPDMPASDVLYEVRASLNRVSVAAAALYR